MSKPDWVRWAPSRWLSGVLHLNNEQRGVYIQIINVILDLGECQDDARYIGRLCNCRSHAARRIVDELIAAGKLISENGKLRQNRAETELELARKLTEKGRLMAGERWKNKALGDAASTCKPEQEPRIKKESSPDGEPKKEPAAASPQPTPADKPRAPRRKGKLTPPPPDFQLTTAMLADAEARNPHVDWPAEFQNFLSHHASKGTQFVDWNKAWVTWRDKPYQKIMKPGGNGRARDGPRPFNAWVDASREWLEQARKLDAEDETAQEFEGTHPRLPRPH